MVGLENFEHTLVKVCGSVHIYIPGKKGSKVFFNIFFNADESQTLNLKEKNI